MFLAQLPDIDARILCVLDRFHERQSRCYSELSRRMRESRLSSCELKPAHARWSCNRMRGDGADSRN